MPSPGRTPYRGTVLSPTPPGSSVSENMIPRIPISSYLAQNDGNYDSQDGADRDMIRMNQQLDQWSAKLKTMVLVRKLFDKFEKVFPREIVYSLPSAVS